ncbi:MAG TPA: putative LPS assembly protein LptD, partial [Paludibacter sp.]|nr:putative LPS assembly protein LptD [Paludibacter sp.]
PVSATFNILKYINVSPSVNYNERWYMQSYNQSWDATNKRVKTDTVSGFNRVYDFNMGVSASTKLYGFYIPIRSIFGDKVDRIRHVVTPSFGFSYMPDFGDPMWGYYGTYIKQVADSKDPTIFHDETVEYSHYAGSLYGAPGKGKSGSLNFSLGNNVEMKVRNDKDTTGTAPFKKVSLIDNFTVSGSYNLAADSMRWSILNANLRIKLGKSYSLSLSGGFDPYMYGLSKSGSPVRINKLRWENGGFPRFLGTSTSYSYTLSNDTFKKLFDKSKSNKNKSDKTTEPGAEPTTDAAQTTEKQTGDKKKTDIGADGYEKVTIPWSISINYSIRYGNTNVFDKTKMEYEMAFTHNLSFSGNLSLTTNWKFSTSTTYDFKSKEFTYTNLNITRSLHCWQMTASVVPFGIYKSYTFRLGVNASMLADLKYDKQSGYGTTNVNWY